MHSFETEIDAQACNVSYSPAIYPRNCVMGNAIVY